MSFFLELKEISKNFGPVRALSHVSLELRGGEVLALMGENGAGKSTLMKILSGLFPRDEYEGQILLDHQSFDLGSPSDSEKLGIAIIHQELSVFPELTVSENFFVGNWRANRGFVNLESLHAQARHWIDQVGTGIDPEALISELNTGQQQVVEIAKAISKKARILIFDEPTSSLTKQETENLFQIIASLKKQNCGVIYISHRMEEIFRISDRISILRDGQSVANFKTDQVTESKVIEAMVGRQLENLYPQRGAAALGEEWFRCENFRAQRSETSMSFGPLQFGLRRGEILGFGGLLGAGRSEVLSALLGDDSYQTEGQISLSGVSMKLKNLREAYQLRLGLLTEDRKLMSLLPTRSLEENASITRLALTSLTRTQSASFEQEKNREELVKMKTKFHSVDQLITELSGGNQQKVILSRVMQNQPQLIVLDEPTRGVDVGAKFEIYQMIRDWTQTGVSILLVSSDLPELLAMSDRILVMSHRKQVAILERENMTQENIMKWALKGFESNEAVLAE